MINFIYFMTFEIQVGTDRGVFVVLVLVKTRENPPVRSNDHTEDRTQDAVVRHWSVNMEISNYQKRLFTFKFFNAIGPPSKRTPKPSGPRQRPYKDPYMPVSPEDFDQLEAASVLSGWSMGDDVRQILYDDVESSVVSSGSWHCLCLQGFR